MVDFLDSITLLNNCFLFTLQILDNGIDQHYDKSSQNIQSQNEMRFKTLDERIDEMEKVSFREKKAGIAKKCLFVMHL